jgi:hypothetical protein
VVGADRFVRCERPSAQQLDAHHPEVVAASKIRIEQRTAVFRRHGLGQKAGRAGPFVEGNIVDDAHAGHSRKRAQAVHEVEMEAPPRRPVLEAFLIRCELERVDVAGVVSGIDTAQPLETLHQQRRPDQQNQRERRLPDHQNIAPQVAPASRAA